MQVAIVLAMTHVLNFVLEFSQLIVIPKLNAMCNCLLDVNLEILNRYISLCIYWKLKGRVELLNSSCTCILI